MIDAKHFDFDSEKQAYVQELSMLHRANGRCPNRTFTLSNCPEEGMHRSFRQVKVDWSGEDIAGWWYEEFPGPNCGPVPLKVLLIND